ncbi:5546_t:CDS:1, partial [Cetraspora pellucida]
PLFGQQSDPLVIQQVITNVQINHYNIQPSYTLIDIPWWLLLLEISFQHLLDEHNNFSSNYL